MASALITVPTIGTGLVWVLPTVTEPLTFTPPPTVTGSGVLVMVTGVDGLGLVTGAALGKCNGGKPCGNDYCKHRSDGHRAPPLLYQARAAARERDGTRKSRSLR